MSTVGGMAGESGVWTGGLGRSREVRNEKVEGQEGLGEGL